jgi:hypothetical protein
VGPTAGSWQAELADFLRLLALHRVPFLVVGGYAVAHAGHLRATKDLDLWIPRRAEASARMAAALEAFLGEAVPPARLEAPFLRFFVGRPGAIDVLRELPGVRWDTAWPERSYGRLFGQRVPFLGRRALLRNKRTVGRHIDLADVEELLRTGLTRRDRRPKQ